MDVLEEEFEKTKDAQCFLSELIMVLTVPSVGSKYIWPTELETIRYSKWYERYVEFENLSGEECYALRCELFHNGDADIYSQQIIKKNPDFFDTIPEQKNEIKSEKYDYRLSLPSTGDMFYFEYNSGKGHISRPFCSAGLALQIMEGYNRFKLEYPKFEYPLFRKKSN